MRNHCVPFVVLLMLVSVFCGCRNEGGRGPKYGTKDREVVLPQAVLEGVNCHLEDYSIPWGRPHPDATVVVIGTQVERKSLIRLRSAPVTQEIVRFEYKVTKVDEGAFPHELLSFLSLEVYKDGVVYDRPGLPAKCKFFLAESQGKYRIVSMENAGP